MYVTEFLMARTRPFLRLPSCVRHHCLLYSQSLIHLQTCVLPSCLGSENPAAFLQHGNRSSQDQTWAKLQWSQRPPNSVSGMFCMHSRVLIGRVLRVQEKKKFPFVLEYNFVQHLPPFFSRQRNCVFSNTIHSPFLQAQLPLSWCINYRSARDLGCPGSLGKQATAFWTCHCVPLNTLERSHQGAIKQCSAWLSLGYCEPS